MTSDALKPFNRLGEPTRWPVFDRVATLVESNEIRVVEIGVSPAFSNGLSTVYWHQDPRVKSVLSIDIKDREIAKLTGVMGEMPKVRFVIGHSLPILSSLPNESIDLLYLDGDMDPALTFHEYLAACPKLRPGAIVLCDDFNSKVAVIYKAVTGEKVPFAYKGYGFWQMTPSSLFEAPSPSGTGGMFFFRHDGPPKFQGSA